MLEYSYLELEDGVLEVFEAPDVANYSTQSTEANYFYAENTEEPDMFLHHLKVIVYEVKHNILTEGMKKDFFQYLRRWNDNEFQYELIPSDIPVIQKDIDYVCERLGIKNEKKTEGRTVAKDVYITITGTNHYFGMTPFEIGKVLKCKKEKSNPYDDEAIKVVMKNLGTIGYVANSPYTKVRGTYSAGAMLGIVEKNFRVKVMFMTSTEVICKVIDGFKIDGDNSSKD